MAVADITLTDGSRLYGQEVQTETHPDTGSVSVQFKTANRELDPQRLDFRWVNDDAIQAGDLSRGSGGAGTMENGNFFGLLDRVDATGLDVAADGSPIERLHAALDAVRAAACTSTSIPLPHR